MPFEQTITIINNSGKIISTGKHLVGIFKEARTAYKEKKEALRQDRPSPVRRAHTFNVPRSGSYHGPIVEEYDDGPAYDEHEDGYRRNHRSLGPGPVPLYLESGRSGRRSLDDGDRRSYYSSGSRRRNRPHRGAVGADGASHAGHGERRPSQPPLTASNLRTLSEISATRPPVVSPSRRPFRGPCDEPASRDVELSRQNPGPLRASQASAGPDSAPDAAIPSVRTSMMVHRPRSDPALSRHTGSLGGGGGGSMSASTKPIDMNLAYGNIPPDLESRVDLDPIASAGDGTASQRESQAKTLVDRIEALLNEAQCLHHTAASIICHLQDNPEAAAAVALTLAELSALLAKLSPAFLGVVKGGSPAVFALLASPQFLIGTSIAVGVTVILFGGWKIIKRISEVRAAREEEKMAFELADQAPQAQQQADTGSNLGPPLAASRAPISSRGVYDEALVLEEELSTIESWRRGIEYDEDTGTEPWGGSEADVELISPEALRSRVGDDDQRTLRSTRTTKSHGATSLRSSRNRHRSKHRGTSTHEGEGAGHGKASPEVPPRQSSKGHQGDEASEVQGRHRRHGGDTGSDAGSTRSHHSRRHSSGRSRRGTSTAPDDGGARDSSVRSQAPASEAGTTRSRESKKATGSGNMLKQLFKKNRGKDEKAREDAVSLAVV
ncbi:hypothetical protein SCUCBS95973_000336 [Sporothrix curviconia]|uniref:Uncharacterized protein n=1 Tax=Sporothrix curviconia TaxID=1260050 RepID=A0ABP0APD3_9PEZI